jgi:4-hydroxybenzoate polyprenyltransferase
VPLRPYLELIRPANVVTALADVLAGFAVAGLAAPTALPWLLVSTACLYAGGIVLNDVFDRHLDRQERPERPIPSGRITAARAATCGGALLALGVLTAASATAESLRVALVIVAAILVYDAWSKRRWIGPVNMGICRGLNLLLGMSAAPGTIAAFWPLSLLSVAYIAGVTLVSRGEVSGGRRPPTMIALALVSAALGGLLLVGATARASAWSAFALIALLAWRVLPPFSRAARDPSPEAARAAVRTGVLSLVLVDAAVAAAFAGMIYSLAVLATAALAGRMARQFAVT